MYGYGANSSSPTITDSPFTVCTFRIVKRNNTRCYCVAIERDNNGIETATWTSSLSPAFSGWTPLATATPPQEFNLPLADGITALQPCTYWKNQFGEVTIGGCASGAVSHGSTIATLPEGYRPSRYVERPATFTEGGSRFAGSVFIDTAGIVTIHTPSEATNVVFAASFLAKN